ncbi:hypothetical protein B0J13DRAFT_523478 [Dactylonectria estremocensis]|uniref:Uncharacterized protein n=1 Tax=Dactylonectria estremocensis TaxID=1079267 RepID=A0A9P9F279_9HYPO|nr:hypothetical protein B0J13DRAFT_523478 [Dactylonectria estremocensis]
MDVCPQGQGKDPLTEADTSYEFSDDSELDIREKIMLTELLEEFGPNPEDDWAFDYTNLTCDVYTRKIEIEKEMIGKWETEAHEVDSWRQYYSACKSGHMEPYRTYKEMQELRHEVLVLQRCVTILEFKSTIERHEYFHSESAFTDADFMNYWILIKDFALIYRRYLETGDQEELFDKCRNEEPLNWLQANWIRMFVLLTFGPNLEELERPRFVDGAFRTNHIILHGKQELESALNDARISQRFLLKSVFRISTVEVWTLRGPWLWAHDLVLHDQRQRSKDDWLDREVLDEGICNQISEMGSIDDDEISEMDSMDDDDAFLEDFHVDVEWFEDGEAAVSHSQMVAYGWLYKIKPEI